MYGYLIIFRGIYQYEYDSQMRHYVITLVTVDILELYAESASLFSSTVTT